MSLPSTWNLLSNTSVKNSTPSTSTALPVNRFRNPDRFDKSTFFTNFDIQALDTKEAFCESVFYIKDFGCSLCDKRLNLDTDFRLKPPLDLYVESRVIGNLDNVSPPIYSLRSIACPLCAASETFEKKIHAYLVRADLPDKHPVYSKEFASRQVQRIMNNRGVKVT